LKNLQTLGLEGIEGNAEWVNLKDLTNLRDLAIDGPVSSDDHLIGIEALSHLTKLSPGHSTTDAGLSHLSRLTSLRMLVLQRCKITDDGLAHLACLKNLQELYLDGNAITDAGLRHIEDLSALENLGIDDTPVTDNGLLRLRKLNRLRELDVFRTQVTESGVRRLREVLPNVQVSH
jgi:Leucine-rich repeat (LRR) protein